MAKVLFNYDYKLYKILSSEKNKHYQYPQRPCTLFKYYILLVLKWSSLNVVLVIKIYNIHTSLERKKNIHFVYLLLLFNLNLSCCGEFLSVRFEDSDWSWVCDWRRANWYKKSRSYHHGVRPVSGCLVPRDLDSDTGPHSAQFIISTPALAHTALIPATTNRPNTTVSVSFTATINHFVLSKVRFNQVCMITSKIMKHFKCIYKKFKSDDQIRLLGKPSGRGRGVLPTNSLKASHNSNAV